MHSIVTSPPLLLPSALLVAVLANIGIRLGILTLRALLWGTDDIPSAGSRQLDDVRATQTPC